MFLTLPESFSFLYPIQSPSLIIITNPNPSIFIWINKCWTNQILRPVWACCSKWLRKHNHAGGPTINDCPFLLHFSVYKYALISHKQKSFITYFPHCHIICLLFSKTTAILISDFFQFVLGHTPIRISPYVYVICQSLGGKKSWLNSLGSAAFINRLIINFKAICVNIAII